MNYSIKHLINWAYETSISKVEGLPEWTDSIRYDITAKADRPITAAEKRAMLRSLLEDRFKLKMHVETSDGPVYVLTVVTPGKLGPNIRSSSPDCVARAEDFDKNGYTQLPCSRFSPQPSNFRFPARTMPQLADALVEIMQRPVIDQTNLQGRFDVGLWADIGAFIVKDAQPTNDRGEPSVFAAVQEQWGMKLTASRAPVKTFVVDSIEKPTPD